tara:strand:+ start:5747 stop:6073 length:327 start_codon:yes stop_codon:yes gene_type:complete
MAFTSSVLNEFVRRIYRISDEQDIKRSDYLDNLADAALDAVSSGKSISSSSGQGLSVAYERFYGWNPGELLELIGASRAVIDEVTVDLALAEISPVRHISSNFNSIQK